MDKSIRKIWEMERLGCKEYNISELELEHDTQALHAMMEANMYAEAEENRWKD